MSRSSFSKAYKEIANLNPMEMTFTIEDADLDKLHEVLNDVNVKECPWFEVRDKHGNEARYYREPQWIPCSEGLPPEDQDVFVYLFYNKCPYIAWVNDGHWRTEEFDVDKEYEPIAWMPLPEPARLENV